MSTRRFSCPHCGAEVKFNDEKKEGVCEYCGMHFGQEIESGNNVSKSKCHAKAAAGPEINPVHEWYLADARREKRKKVLGAIICAVLLPIFVWSWNRIPPDKRIDGSIASETEEIIESEIPAVSADSDVVKTVNPEDKEHSSVLESKKESSYTMLLPSMYFIICFMIMLVVVPVIFSFFG